MGYLLCLIPCASAAGTYQPHLTKSLLEQIREVHQENLVTGLEGASKEGKETGGARGAGRKASGGEEAASASGGSGGGAVSEASWYETDALGLVPFFSEQASTTAGDMNFLNKTSGAMSLAADVAGIASSIGQGGNLAGFLRDLGHTCSSSPASLRQAIRVSWGSTPEEGYLREIWSRSDALG